MTLARKVELLHRSTERMMKALEQTRDLTWWAFMRRETWIHLKRSWELWWLVLMGKE